MNYVKLLDKIHYNEVIRVDGRKQYRYVFGADEWKRTGILLRYQNEDSEYYDKYQTISEAEAFVLIRQKKEMLQKAYDFLLVRMEKAAAPAALLLYFREAPISDLEVAVAALAYGLGRSGYEKAAEEFIFSPGITHTVEVLFEAADLHSKDQMIPVRMDSKACAVMKQIVTYKETQREITPQEADWIHRFLKGETNQL